MIPTDRDWTGLFDLERRIRAMPSDYTAKISCFNKDEADWIAQQLRTRGHDRFYCTWLTWRDVTPAAAPQD